MKYKLNKYYGFYEIKSIEYDFKVDIDSITGKQVTVNGKKSFISYVTEKEQRGGHGEGSISESIYCVIDLDYSAKELKDGDIIEL